jgi:integrase
MHTLRHRFATVAYQESTDLRTVQELLGHMLPVTTGLYTAVADESKQRAAAGGQARRLVMKRRHSICFPRPPARFSSGGGPA